MAEHANLIEIPIHPGELFTQDTHTTIQGGGTRLVPLVRVNGSDLPCIWKSHRTCYEDTRGDGANHPAHECLLLVSRSPILTLRAVIEVDAWRTFPTGPVEW